MLRLNGVIPGIVKLAGGNERTRVIELSSLTDGETTRSKDKDLLDINSRLSSLVLGLVTSWHDNGDELLSDGTVRHVVNENVEKEFGVFGTRAGLGVELDREVGETVLALPDTLVGAVVGVLEKLRPAILEGGDIDLRGQDRDTHQHW